MKIEKSFYPFSANLSPLNIKDLSFTTREIDVLACLLHLRGTSKIASLLKISPNTVITHTRNIMHKVGCNSREGIIDFIEHTPEYKILKHHYSFLRLQHIFQSSLDQIKKTHSNKPKITLILLGDNQVQKNILLSHLEKDLNLAGVRTHVKMPKAQENISSDPSVFYIFTQEKNAATSKDSPKQDNIIRLSQQTNYYFFVFIILGKVHPSPQIQKISKEFETQYQHIVASVDTSENNIANEPFNSFEKSPIKPSNFLNRSGPSITMFIIFIVIAGLSWNFYSGQYQPTLSARSDLIIPAEAVLLNRPTLLKKIEEKLSGPEKIRTVVIVGIGGIGKTILARHAAQNDPAKIIWTVSAETQESLKYSFENLAEALAISGGEKEVLNEIKNIEKKDEKDKQILQFVKNHLKKNQNWLLIFDNAERYQDLQDYIPQDDQTWGSGKVLITTRNRTFENLKFVNYVLPIEELSREDMLTLFSKIITNGNEHTFSEMQKKEALNFLEKIPPYPLDVTIAAYYLKATQSDYNKYLDNLYKDSHDFEKIQQNILAESGEYGKTRYGVITLSLQELLSINKEFADLLLFISLLDSQNIPTDLLDMFKGGPIVDSFIYHLKKYSLISKDDTPLGKQPALSLHKSTQDITLNFLVQKLGLHPNHPVLSSIGAAFEEYLLESLEGEKTHNIQDLVAHCNAFLKQTYILPLTMHSTIGSTLGAYYYNLGNYEQARVILEAHIQNLEAHHEPKSQKRAWALAYLGDTYRELGLYQKAKTSLEKSYYLYKELSIVSPKTMGWILTRLSNINRHLGFFEKAKDFLLQALTIYETKLPDNRRQIAWAKTYLANLYKNLGEFEKAKALLEESLIAHKRLYGDSSIRTAWAMTYLGDVFREMGENQKAKNLLEKGLAIYEKKYGRDNIENARIIRNLGQTYLALNHLEKAEDLLLEAHEILKKRDHPDLYLSFESLFDLNQAKAEKEEDKTKAASLKAQAIENLNQAEEILKANFDPNSPLIKKIEQKRLH